ncbi:sterol desaturase family protein [Spirosoma arcticum]
MNKSVFERFAASFLDQAIWYFLWTIPFFLVFWVIGKRYFANRRIQPVQRADTRQYIAEIRHSLVFVLLYSVADLWLLHGSSGAADTGGLFKIYTDINEHGGVLYSVFTCFVLFVIDDTWFYWMHRTIHHPMIYKYMHKVHHESVDTTPFTAYRFHPAEGILEMGSAVLIIGYAAVVPVHLGAIIAWQVGAIAFNVIGHMGYEIYPAWWTNHWLLKWKTPSTHHNMHHERFDGNYGLYFLWWDRIMNTEIGDYEATYRALFRRGKAETEGDDAVEVHRKAYDDGADQPASLPARAVAQAQITLAGQVHEVPVHQDETLLDAALRAGVSVPYLCRSGRCGTCRAVCTAGEVTMNETQTYLTLQAIQQGQILMCQSRARSEQIDLRVS